MKWNRAGRFYELAIQGDYRLRTYTAGNLLRNIVRNMDGVAESINDGRTVEELISIYVAHLQAEFDIPPDRWSERQLREAARGVVPRWDRNERPIYAPPTGRRK